MSTEVWMGYVLHHESTYTVVQSPFVLNGVRVFGADSDATTLAVAGLLHRINHDEIASISVPDGIDDLSLSAATGVSIHDDDSEGESPWEVLMSDQAIIVVAKKGADVEIAQVALEVEVDPAFNEAIEAAWTQELSEAHVSQGAYVSRAQYEEAASSRLQLHAQSADDDIIWPPRFSHMVNGTNTASVNLQRRGSIQTWTTLSAAGAPSEFSLRAPILGGMSTVLLSLEDGPSGVFLTVDDEDTTFEMDAQMELVFRRLYGQEGLVRYGLKARTIHD